ncbi:MAG: histidinol dehydrogenase, partial [Muribaculaceae bacterium]|nr:histidinol dehydrogenase [Muribaculaceae bacterium]
YIPGGRAPLFSTVLMLALPAKIAGCREIILCTPENGEHGIAPEILFAARLCGIHRVFRIGGAQAVAAMAYGTRSVPKVDKIFGPGNRFVTKAKQMVSRVTAIDMPAGPSEVMVLADETADPTFVAADMLSQAEHGPDSQAIALCSSSELAEAVKSEVERLADTLPRRDSIEGSLSHSRIIIFPSREDMTEFANDYAPEHLILSVSDPWALADNIYAAGSVFIGNFSPESAGDYASGTNHTLPTSGWARSFSGVNIDSFMHKITYQQLTREGLALLGPVITSMAHAEGLDAHALAVDVRTK